MPPSQVLLISNKLHSISDELNIDLLIAIIEISNPLLYNSLPKIFIAFSAPPPETELVTIEIRTTGEIVLDKDYAKKHVT
jgi:hypothetical protein